jgi:FecR-like protein
MKTITVLAALAAGLAQLQAAPLTESTVTEIVKEVNVLPPGAANPAPAKLNALIKAPERVRTGAESRTELTAADRTITRIGANTVFAFETTGRVINLERGSILFHSPKGAGGGTIKSGGASAAILGTTLIVATTPDGGFKVIVLEGRARVTLPNGRQSNLDAGQMVFVLPAGAGFSNVLDINLGRLVAGSLLVTGFSRELPSVAQISAAVKKQNGRLEKGDAVDTGMSADQFASSYSKARYGLNAIDNNSYKAAVPPALTPAQLSQFFDAQGLPIGSPGGAGVVPIANSRGGAAP